MTRINAPYPSHIKRAVRTGTLTTWGVVLLLALAVGLRHLTGNFSLLWVLPICAPMIVLLVFNTRALRIVQQWGWEIDNRTTGT